jgi:hypothetical protein
VKGRHRRHRLTVQVEHTGHIRVATCDECMDPAETLRVMRAVVAHLEPLAGPPPS